MEGNIQSEKTSFEFNDTYSRSCDACRKRKIRCGRLKPSCLRCIKMGLICTRDKPFHKRGPKPKLSLENQPQIESSQWSLLTNLWPHPDHFKNGYDNIIYNMDLSKVPQLSASSSPIYMNDTKLPNKIDFNQEIPDKNILQEFNIINDLDNLKISQNLNLTPTSTMTPSNEEVEILVENSSMSSWLNYYYQFRIHEIIPVFDPSQMLYLLTNHSIFSTMNEIYFHQIINCLYRCMISIALWHKKIGHDLFVMTWKLYLAGVDLENFELMPENSSQLNQDGVFYYNELPNEPNMIPLDIPIVSKGIELFHGLLQKLSFEFSN